MPVWGESLAVNANYACVTTQNNSLEIVDINPPSSAHIMGSIFMDDAQDVDVQGDYAYVADASYGLQIIDVRVPITPVL